jgi:glycosyltransferase involved in cell wall biosynthesis
MRFVFLSLGCHPDHIGGAYRYVAEVAARLAARGHEVTVIYPAANPALPPEEMRDGVRLKRYPDQKGFFWNNWRRENALARALLKQALDGAPPTLVVPCHGYFANAVRGFRTAFLFTGPWAEEFRFSRQAAPRTWWKRQLDQVIAARLCATEREALKSADRILTISRYYEEKLPQWHPVALPPVRLIFGGVDHRQFAPVSDRATLRARYHLAEDDFLFLTVRRLDPRMGLLALLEAFAQAAAEHPRARLYLAGKGPQHDELAARITALNLGQRIKLLGFVPDAELPLWFNAADCTVMPSLDLEGFGLSTVESLACGTPVLGSSAGATPELLAPLSPALVYPIDSTEALTARLKAVLQNPKSLPTREQCRDYALNRFKWDDVAAALEQCFTELNPT